MIEEFVHDVCEILNIDAPAVSYDTKQFPTSTMMAQCSPDGSVIFVKKYEKHNPDQFLRLPMSFVMSGSCKMILNAICPLTSLLTCVHPS